jgi:ABC-type transport system involved in multi-copper enzyme maturation permease subunit
MTAQLHSPPRSPRQPGRDPFARLLHAELTKFRTVRGWLAGILIAGLLVVAVNLLPGRECGMQNGSVITAGGAGCAIVLGPGGEAVNDGFYFVHRPLTPHGALTVQVTSMTGANLPWSKAGIIVKASTRQGAAYAAMMVTGGHGVRLQWDYVNDVAGRAGRVSAAHPRWLRLARSGNTITGYDSVDGTHWIQVGAVTLAGLPSAAQAGLFAASPGYSTVTSQSIGSGTGSGGSTLATAAFDHVAVAGASPGVGWRGTAVGGVAQGEGYHVADGVFTVTGAGDISPLVPGGSSNSDSVQPVLVGAFAGLIAVIVVATMFITAEYRRGLIRVTLTASPRRGRVLAAKAVVAGIATFAVTLPAAFGAWLLGEHKLRSGGISIAPVPALTEVRMIAGTAALVAVTAVLALAIGAMLRRSAAAITAVIALIVVPYFFASPLAVLPASAADWLLRVTPAAGFAIQQAYPRYPQVAAGYTPGDGYYPLGPWAGFAVLCAWTVLALAAASYLLRRRDA